MGEIVKQFGEAVLSVIVVCLLLFLLFKVNGDGFVGQIHATVPEAEDAYIGNHDEFEQIVGSERPVINFRYTLDNGTKSVIKANTVYDLQGLFLAEDAQGTKLEVKIKDVCEAGTGRSILLNMDEATGVKEKIRDPVAFVFPSAGIYAISLVATDAQGITVKKTIQVPVSGS